MLVSVPDAVGLAPIDAASMIVAVTGCKTTSENTSDGTILVELPNDANEARIAEIRAQVHRIGLRIKSE